MLTALSVRRFCVGRVRSLTPAIRIVLGVYVACYLRLPLFSRHTSHQHQRKHTDHRTPKHVHPPFVLSNLGRRIIDFFDYRQFRLVVLPRSIEATLMPRSLRSPRHEALRKFLVERRKAVGMTQAELARRIDRYQSFIADVERGQRRVDVVEFLDFAEALKFDPSKAVKAIGRSPR
jgi:DNA-binding XRE family transcriptional regulator